MKKNKSRFAVMLIATVVMAGCATQQQLTKNKASANEAASGERKMRSKDGTFDGEIIGTPAAGSRFAKLQIGMSQRQVEDLIGQPSDIKTYTTGKAFIPLYFGGDAWRMETFYKKEGRLTFAGGGLAGSNPKLIRITVNTAESGYQ